MKSKSNKQKTLRGNNNQKSSQLTGRVDPALMLRPSYPGQYLTTMKLLGDPAILTTTVTTGVVADARIINSGGAAGMNNFATRFAAFEEYRIIKAEYELNFFSSTSPGLACYWLDETSQAAPTATEAQQRSGVKQISLSAVNTTHKLVYVPHSPTEQIWNPVTTSQSLATFKFYTDNANFGATIVATQIASVRTIFTVQFRGIQ